MNVVAESRASPAAAAISSNKEESAFKGRGVSLTTTAAAAARVNRRSA
jgi:hypothetical protein